MIKYKSLEISDKMWIDEIVKNAEIISSEYSFESNFLWKDYLKLDLIDNREFFSLYSNKTKSYLFPLLKDKKNNYDQRLTQIVDLLRQDAAQKGISLKFYGISIEEKSILQRVFQKQFRFLFASHSSDYIFEKNMILRMTGRSNTTKRNHVNRFQELYPNWRYEVLDSSKFQDCLQMVDQWFENKKNKAQTDALQSTEADEILMYEVNILRKAFEYFEQLDLSGGVLIVDEKVVGLNLGVMINNQVFDHIIQKALVGYRGIYDFLSWCLAGHLPKECMYVNAEEDLGIRNLRISKLRLHPDEIIDKYLAIYC